MNGSVIGVVGALVGFALVGAGGIIVEMTTPECYTPRRGWFAGALLVIGLVIVFGSVIAAPVFDAWNLQPQPTLDCYSLEDSLADHYFVGETARRYATAGRITVNGEATHSDADLSQCLCEGDRIEIRLEHPPINPDGTPGDDRRRWTVERPGGAP